MKKTRILASLLCIMMVVCALPMMQASAVAPALAPTNLNTAIAQAMSTMDSTNYVWARPMADGDFVTYANCNLDFAAADIAQNPYLTVLNNGVTFNAENGAVFGGTQGIMRYYPAAANKTATENWSPVMETPYFAYSFKLNEGGTLSSRALCNNNYTDAIVDVTPDGVTIVGGDKPGTGGYLEEGGLDIEGRVGVTYTNKDYTPGTEWNDVLIKMTSTQQPYQVWMKKATDSSFVKVAEATYPANPAGGKNPYNIGFGNDYTSRKKGVTFIGTNANVGYAVSYKGVGAMPYASMEEILGGPVASTYAFDFDANSNFANSVDRIGFTATGFKSEADGLTLVDAADTSSNFKFAPFGNYSPLHGSTNWGEPSTATDYDPQALYLKAKGDFRLLIAGPRTYGHIDMYSNVGKKLSPSTDGATLSQAYYPLNEWTEYLIVPNQRTAGTLDVSTGYSLFVKGEKGTNGEWWKILDQKFKSSGTRYNNYGISFRSVVGHIKSVRVLSLTKNVTNAVATPANATYAYLDEEFDVAPSYSGVQSKGNLDGNGNMVFPTTEHSLDCSTYGLEIPVGGYAEFKVTYDGIANYRFYDGVNSVSIGQQSDYNSVTGGYSFHGANNTAWKTWRVLRTESGYDIYVKADGDTGWTQIATGARAASTTSPRAIMSFGTRNGSNPKVEAEILVGDSKMAYFKVYGPAPTGALTLLDGCSGTPLTDGEKLDWPEELRAIATPESGKLLVVSYKGDDMAKAQIIDVADMVDDSVYVNAKVSDATKVRVFLWDGFSGLNRLTPAVTLNL